MSFCTKDQVGVQRDNISLMLGNHYYMSTLPTTKVSTACGYMQYNIRFSNTKEYFEINITSDGPLKPGIYIMAGGPTIKIPGRCAFWNSSPPNGGYTPSSMRLYLSSFDNNRIIATFEGDDITNGIINVQMPKYTPNN